MAETEVGGMHTIPQERVPEFVRHGLELRAHANRGPRNAGAEREEADAVACRVAAAMRIDGPTLGAMVDRYREGRAVKVRAGARDGEPHALHDAKHAVHENVRICRRKVVGAHVVIEVRTGGPGRWCHRRRLEVAYLHEFASERLGRTRRRGG